jgi:catechol 2,3-dioxygenase-like lactoylglutathione lyase family enzyme
VTAFKFRDPEGHPLELLGFADGSTPVRWQRRSANRFLGIDHSAISVADTARSIAFYQPLGLTVTGGSTNIGPEQQRLDGVSQADVDVTTLALPTAPSPHIELLRYRRGMDRSSVAPAPNDVVSTRLVLTVSGQQALQTLCYHNREALLTGPEQLENDVWRAMLRDPDNHRILLEAAS